MNRLAFALLLAATPLAAQQPQPHQPPQHLPPGSQHAHDPFVKHLFPPELIMQRQAEIGLRDAQREQISAELQKAQQTFTSVQWRIAAEAEKLGKLLEAEAVDESRVLAQVDAILNLEREVKRTHMTLLVRIRNALTDDQRRRLRQLRGD